MTFQRVVTLESFSRDEIDVVKSDYGVVSCFVMSAESRHRCQHETRAMSKADRLWLLNDHDNSIYIITSL